MVPTESDARTISNARIIRLTPARRAALRRAATGFFCGAFFGMGCSLLGIYHLFEWDDLFLTTALLFALLSLTRGRVLVWGLTGLMLLALLVVGYTPLVKILMKPLERVDTLRPVPAIVVLSSHAQKDGELSASAQERILQGYTLLRQGYAPTLVLTQATEYFGNQIPAVRQQMEALGLNYPIEEVGPVSNTHDEAVKVAALAKERGWETVILVTHPWHNRRAAGVFEKAGVRVLCSPCVEGEYDLSDLNTPIARLHAFRDWLHESLGYAMYRRRGWL